MIGDRPLVADSVADGPLILWQLDRGVGSLPVGVGGGIFEIYRFGHLRTPSEVRWVCYGRPRIPAHRQCCPACRGHR